MSTSATFEDPVVFDESMASVRADDSNDLYVIVEHVGNDPKQLHVVGTGQDLEEIVDHLDDAKVMYILARYQSTFDMSTTVKFVFFRWLGEIAQSKGKFGVVFGNIQEKFNPFHLFVETGSREDFHTEKISQQLAENTGMKSKVIERTLKGTK